MKANAIIPRLYLFLIFSVIVFSSKAQAPDKLIHLLLDKKIISPAEADSLLALRPALNTTRQKGGKIWGLSYTDVMYKAHADSARRGNVQYSGQPKDSSGYDFRRIYLGYNYVFGERFSTEFILSHESPADALQSGNRGVFVKAANLRWHNIFPRADLIAGLSGTPTLTFVGDREGAVWAYRSVERSVTDMRKLGISSDAGIQLLGRLDEAGTLGYAFMAGNGSGVKPENDPFKKFYGEVYGRFWKKKLLLDLYGDYERTRLRPYHQSHTTLKATLAYQAERFTLGAEVVEQYQQKNTIYSENVPGQGIGKDTADALSLGISVFGSVRLIKEKLDFFARLDYFNPDLRFAPRNFYSSTYTGSTQQRFFTAGADYTPAKDIHIIPNAWYNGFLTAADAYNKVKPSSLLHADYDLVYRITLYYVFNR